MNGQSSHNCCYTVNQRGWLTGGANEPGLPGEKISLSRKKVSIVGFEQAYTPSAPMDDPSYEVWGLNHANRIGFMVDSNGRFRADRWFDLHQEHAQSSDDLEWIHNCELPIYLTDKFTDNPYALAYPIEEVVAAFGYDYFCSSFAYMLVLAAIEGFEEIRLDGINLSYGRERLVERGNLEFWIGLLRGEGYNIVIPESSTLLVHPHRYGFDYSDEKRAVEQAMAVSVLECLNDKEVRAMAFPAMADHLRLSGIKV
jgi:hypothetical protein